MRVPSESVAREHGPLKPRLTRRRLFARAAALAMLLATLLVGALPAAGLADRSDRPKAGLPLGRPGLPETRESRTVAAGVSYTRIVRGQPSWQDRYTIDVGFRSDRAAARELARRLRSDGHWARVVRVDERAPDDPQRGALGYLVRTGSFTTEAEATALRERLAAQGYIGLRVVFTGEDGGRTTGPWVVHVLEIDPSQIEARLDGRLATDVVPEREPLSSLAARSDALASLNGGYFVIPPSDGTPGDLAGISVLDGTLISEAVNGRSSLLLPDPSGAGARVAGLSTRLTATAADGAAREVDGLNRKPGLIRGCGGTGGDAPTEQPKHDFTCTDASELIHFTAAFGATTESGDGAEAALDGEGRVLELRGTRGGPIPIGGSVLSATGDGADWLRDHARPGTTVAIDEEVLADGTPLALGETLDVINGGPRLLRAGQPAITAASEGFHWPENPEFYYRFGVRRNPRTLAGIADDGRLVLVAVDGRRPGWSVGASFQESAAVMTALGASEALNLDGGGSTGMTLGPGLVSRPSDATGERPIADALVIAPPG